MLDWVWRLFPHSHGPIEDGHEWLHDLQITVEDGHWQVVTLTLAASPRFVDAFAVEFGLSPDGSEA